MLIASFSDEKGDKYDTRQPKFTQMAPSHGVFIPGSMQKYNLGMLWILYATVERDGSKVDKDVFNQPTTVRRPSGGGRIPIDSSRVGQHPASPLTLFCTHLPPGLSLRGQIFFPPQDSP